MLYKDDFDFDPNAREYNVSQGTMMLLGFFIFNMNSSYIYLVL